MSGGVEKLLSDIGQLAEASFRADYDFTIETGLTPIEGSFIVALKALNHFALITGRKGGEWWRMADIIADTVNIGPRVLAVQRQVVVFDRWPIDFIVSVKSKANEPRFAAIECDGHDFHERTKEQAERDRSRDRKLQKMGFTVFRFTGREIHRDPIKCAAEVMDWACSDWLESNDGD